ncbi:PAS domain S-box [Candidatus Magnetomorum sp. HK-1]|nr:PAS domain S-box [Candidatus Magnetomorum sp. HK-1]
MISRFFIFILIFCIQFICFNPIKQGYADTSKNVLYLNSYHSGYKWSDDILRGIHSVFNKHRNLHLFTEFMDTKRFFDKNTFDHFKEYLKIKYKNTSFDLILTSDDNAFKFIQMNQSDLFTEVPIVFCGVNYLQSSDLKSMKNVTGVNEKADIKATFDLILKLHPTTNLVVFICDQTSTGQKIVERIQDLQPLFPHSVKTMIVDDIEMDDLLQMVAKLPRRSVIYFTTFFRDATGRFFEYDESVSMVANYSNVPIYGVWDFHLGHGIVGGMLTSGYFQGETAAKLGITILNGKSADSIPIIQKSPNRYMFDMEQLKRFSLRVTDIPESSIIENQKLQISSIFIFSILSVGILSFIVIFLLFNNIKRKSAEKNLKLTLDHLEQRVIDRTEEVTLANEKLNLELEERRRTERALEQSHHFLETLIDNLPVAVFTKDAKMGAFTLWNKQCEILYGLTADQVLGKTDFEFFPRKQAEQFRKNDHLTFKKQTRIDILEEKIDTKNHGQRIVHTIKTPIYDENKKPLQLLCISEDITTRKEAEEEIRHQQEFLSNVIDTDPNFIFVKDREDKFVLANKAMADLCGTTVQNLIGKKVSEFNPNKDEVNRYFVDNEAVMTTLQPKFIPEQSFTTSQNEVHYIQIIKKPLIGKDGTADKVLCVATDITERKKTEKELENARIAAESSNLAKSEFLANMSHDLRTPLHGILGFTQILSRNEALMKEIGSAVDTIHNSGEHLLMMINDILDLSKIEAQKLDFREGEIYLPSFLQTISEIIRVRASQQRIAFIVNTSDELPNGIIGDETRLRQILLNLLGNAVKFTQEGEVRFTVKRPEKNVLHFKIEDTGIGIPKEKIDEIFLPFHQVTNNFVQVEGTGLGLAICKKLVFMMKSELNVSSEPGKGSCFEFKLPFKETHISSDIVTPKDQKIIGYDGRVVRILVCDDKITNRDVLSQLLTDIGFEVIEANNGRVCLEMALAHRPDIILMDLMMPEMDGFEATHALRSMPEIEDTIVIAISAGVFSQTRQDSLDAGCNDFIPKPVLTDELLEKISKHLSIKWQYSKDKSLHDGQQLNQALVPPPIHVLDQFHQLVISGRITEIKRQLKQLVENDPKYIPFAEHIQQLAFEFRNDDIQLFINRFRENETDKNK